MNLISHMITFREMGTLDWKICHGDRFDRHEALAVCLRLSTPLRHDGIQHLVAPTPKINFQLIFNFLSKFTVSKIYFVPIKLTVPYLQNSFRPYRKSACTISAISIQYMQHTVLVLCR